MFDYDYDDNSIIELLIAHKTNIETLERLARKQVGSEKIDAEQNLIIGAACQLNLIYQCTVNLFAAFSKYLPYGQISFKINSELLKLCNALHAAATACDLPILTSSLQESITEHLSSIATKPDHGEKFQLERITKHAADFSAESKTIAEKIQLSIAHSQTVIVDMFCKLHCPGQEKWFTSQQQLDILLKQTKLAVVLQTQRNDFRLTQAIRLGKQLLKFIAALSTTENVDYFFTQLQETQQSFSYLAASATSLLSLELTRSSWMHQASNPLRPYIIGYCGPLIFTWDLETTVLNKQPNITSYAAFKDFHSLPKYLYRWHQLTSNVSYASYAHNHSITYPLQFNKESTTTQGLTFNFLYQQLKTAINKLHSFQPDLLGNRPILTLSLHDNNGETGHGIGIRISEQNGQKLYWLRDANMGEFYCHNELEFVTGVADLLNRSIYRDMYNGVQFQTMIRDQVKMTAWKNYQHHPVNGAMQTSDILENTDFEVTHQQLPPVLQAAFLIMQNLHHTNIPAHYKIIDLFITNFAACSTADQEILTACSLFSLIKIIDYCDDYEQPIIEINSIVRAINLLLENIQCLSPNNAQSLDCLLKVNFAEALLLSGEEHTGIALLKAIDHTSLPTNSDDEKFLVTCFAEAKHLAHDAEKNISAILQFIAIQNESMYGAGTDFICLNIFHLMESIDQFLSENLGRHTISTQDTALALWQQTLKCDYIEQCGPYMEKKLSFLPYYLQNMQNKPKKATRLQPPELPQRTTLLLKAPPPTMMNI